MQAQAIDLGKLQPSSIKVKINLQYEHIPVNSSIITAEIKLLYSVQCTVYSVQYDRQSVLAQLRSMTICPKTVRCDPLVWTIQTFFKTGYKSN